MQPINLDVRARQEVKNAGFLIDFPNFNITASTQDETAIADWRDLLWSSIDNDTSRDLDQLEVVERLADGAIRVRIAIADVDAFVPQGSPLDERAAHNTTSVYTGVETFPMLPTQLSEDLSSLLPDENRLAVVIEYSVEEDGTTHAPNIHRAWVRNRAKLVYEEVGAWLDDELSTQIPEIEKIEGLREQLLLQNEAAIRLQKAREANGSLELESVEIRPVMRDGQVVDLEAPQKNAARKIIENFMVAANMVIAQWLPAHGFSNIARVVREPERWPRIRDIAHSYGENLPAQPNPRALAQFLEKRRAAAPDEFSELSLSVLKLLGRGLYEVVKPNQHDGHFGLGASQYTHSTAPNRRYPDLITQRLIKAALLEEKSPYSEAELSAIAERCNEREAAAQKVERLMRKVAAAALFADLVGQTFEAVVTGASEKGVWVRTLHPPVEGRVVRGERGMDVGERVLVRLIKTDVERGFIDFEAAR